MNKPKNDAFLTKKDFKQKYLGFLDNILDELKKEGNIDKTNMSNLIKDMKRQIEGDLG